MWAHGGGAWVGVQIDIKQVGKHEYNPQGWTSQTGETHNRTQFDTHEFRKTVKALATSGVKAASMETRRGAAFNHWNTELVKTNSSRAQLADHVPPIYARFVRSLASCMASADAANRPTSKESPRLPGGLSSPGLEWCCG